MNLRKIVSVSVLVGGAIALTVGFSNCGAYSSGSGALTGSSTLSRTAQSFAASGTSACGKLFALLPTDKDVYKPLQDCIDSIPEGGTLELPPGIYNMHTTVHVRSGITLTTAGNPVCALADVHACAELKALPDAETEFIVGLLGVSGKGATISNIVVNGNRANRMQSSYATLCRNDSNIAQNMQITGTNITMRGVVVKNALCAAGLGILRGSADLTVTNNIFASNGIHDQHGLWSDGMTVIEAARSRFTNNQFIDNTDVDAVFGGCPDCVIQNNTFTHSDAFAGSAFAALQIHAWPDTSGDYTNSDISSNTIDCGAKRRCGFGLILGGEPWYTSPLHGGFFHDNSIKNARNGFLIENASGPIRIKDNIVESSGGQTLTNAGMRTGLAYNIPDQTNVRIEDTPGRMPEYLSQSFSRAIANWWEHDVPFALPVVTPPSAVTDIASVIQSAYRQVLNRDADAAGFTYWTPYLQAGHSQADFIAALSNKPEAMIRALYRELLHREADITGLRYFVDLMDKGASIDEVRNRIMTSPEYKKAGN